jgi:ribonuclease PH
VDGRGAVRREGRWKRERGEERKERTKKREREFQVVTTASMKMAVFWVVAPCSLVEVYRRVRGPCNDRPDDEGSKHL